MSVEKENERRFLEHLERCVNGRDFGAMDEYYAHDFTTTGCMGQQSNRGVDAERGQLEATVRGFPDFRYVVERTIADGDDLVVIARFQGTHEGDYDGIPATGRRVDVPFVDMLRFADGMMVSYWGVFDMSNLRQQLGTGRKAS